MQRDEASVGQASVPDFYKLLRVRKPQGTQKDGIYKAENRGIDADSKGQSEHHNSAESGMLDDGPEGEADIMQKIPQEVSGTHRSNYS